MNFFLKFILLVYITLLSFASYSQLEANHWHFGSGYSLDFSTGVAVQTTGSAMSTFEGCTSFSDQFGNLLFYSNGGGRIPAGGQDPGHIWNKNNDVMYNMQGLEGGGWSASQSSVIIPAPGEPNIYYLFTIDEIEHYVDATPVILASEPNGRGFRYFKIDMSLNSGLGDVIEEDVPVYDYSFEGLCAIRHPNGIDYWILINQDTSGIGVYQVTSNGIQLTGVYSGPTSNGGVSIIKASPNSGDINAPCCSKVMSSFGLFDFDLITGVMTFESDLGGNSIQSFEFSHNGFYLYAAMIDTVSLTPSLIQYNLLEASQTGQDITTTMQIIQQNFEGLYMQLAPDGKIYYIEYSFFDQSTKLGTINCPNTENPTITPAIFSYPYDAVSNFGFFSLPNFPSWIFYNNFDDYIEFGPDTVFLCAGDTLLLNAGVGDSWTWGGQTASGEPVVNFSQFLTVTEPGVYSATVNGPCSNGLAGGSDQITVLPCNSSLPCDNFDIGDTLFICAGDTIPLNPDLSALSNIINIQWTGGSGIFVPSDTISPTSYIPSTTEINQGFTGLSLEVFFDDNLGLQSKMLAYDHSGEDLLFSINTSDGSIDSIQDNTGKDWTAMGYRSNDGLLYGLSNIVTFPSISSINLITGAVNDIFTYTDHQFFAGEYDNVNDVFYAVGMSENNNMTNVDQYLYSINPQTGALDTIGNLNLPGNDMFNFASNDGINGLAYDPTLNVLFSITDNGKLFQINPNNASVTFVGNSVFGLRGLAYDTEQNKLWGINSTGLLYEIDKTTGNEIAQVACQESFDFITTLTYVSPNQQNQSCSDQLFISIENQNPLNLGIDTVICIGDNINLSAPGFQSYLWQDGNTASEYTVSNSGNYVLEITTALGCTYSDSIFVDTINCSIDTNYTIPNVISPNNDGSNDFFVIDNIPINSNLVIYNRWGDLVYESGNYQNNWNGVSNSGNNLVGGVYFYILKPISGEINKGFIHIIR